MLVAGCVIFLLCALVVGYRKSLKEFLGVVRFSRKSKGPSLRRVITIAKHKDLVLPFLLQCSKVYGSRFCMWLSTNFFLVITDPEDAKIVLQSQDLIHKAKSYSLLNNWLGSGLLVAGGPKWQQRRKFLTPAFHFNVLKQFKGAMSECCDILIEKLEGQCTGKPVNIYPFITLFALDVICETALGVRKNAQVHSTSEYISAVQRMCAIIHHRAFSLLEKHWMFFRFSKLYAEEQKLLGVLHGETDNVIRERRIMIKGWDLEKLKAETAGNNYDGLKRRLAFLDMLLIAQMEGKDITDLEIREEVDTFMFEGHDTTSSALSFALLMLSQNEECQEKAYEEAVEFEGIEQETMRYLEAVIKETLRLFPSVPFYSRRVYKEFQLGDLTIPPGVTIEVLAYAIHRNVDIFDDPETFRPERYLNEDCGFHPFSNVAFSAGPRNCIGQKFAMLEMKCTLAALLRRFKLHRAVGVQEPIILAELIIKSGNGIHVVLEDRKCAK